MFNVEKQKVIEISSPPPASRMDSEATVCSDQVVLFYVNHQIHDFSPYRVFDIVGPLGFFLDNASNVEIQGI